MKGDFMLIGILITTVGISLLTLGLVGASIEVYRQLLSALVQQQVSALTEQLPEILRPEGASPAGGAEPAFGSTQILLPDQKPFKQLFMADHLGGWGRTDLLRLVHRPEAEA